MVGEIQGGGMVGEALLRGGMVGEAWSRRRYVMRLL